MKIFSTKLYINWLQIDWLGGGSLSRCSSQLWKCNGAGHSSQLQKIKVVFFVHKGDWVKMSVVWYGGPVVCLASSQCPSQVAELSNCIIQYTLEPLSWLNSFEIPSLFFFPIQTLTRVIVQVFWSFQTRSVGLQQRWFHSILYTSVTAADVLQTVPMDTIHKLILRRCAFVNSTIYLEHTTLPYNSCLSRLRSLAKVCHFGPWFKCATDFPILDQKKKKQKNSFGRSCWLLSAAMSSFSAPFPADWKTGSSARSRRAWLMGSFSWDKSIAPVCALYTEPGWSKWVNGCDSELHNTSQYLQMHQFQVR